MARKSKETLKLEIDICESAKMVVLIFPEHLELVVLIYSFMQQMFIGHLLAKNSSRC